MTFTCVTVPTHYEQGSKGDMDNHRLDRPSELDPFYWIGDRGRQPKDGPDNRADSELQWVEANAQRIMVRCLGTLVRKHKGYGSKNISAAPGGALNGLLVRMADKQARIQNIVYTGGSDDVGEDLTETLSDLLNYCAISIMVIEGTWPGTEKA